MSRSTGTLLIVIGVILFVGGLLTTPVLLWVALWRGYGDGGASAIGFGVLAAVLFGAGIATFIVGVVVRSRPPQV